MPTQPYRVLSFDGGGIRGILTARLLVRLEAEEPGFLDGIDLFAGTSTGAMIALALAHGSTPAEVESLYRDNAEQIFASRGLGDLIPGDELIRANYDNTGLKAGLVEHFGGDKQLGQLSSHVLIPTFNLDRRDSGRPGWAPKFYHNVPMAAGSTDAPDSGELVVDVALMTSAAPTYFPSYQGSIDGGVFANNPSTCAVSKAVDAGANLNEIRLLSFGTGVLPRHVEGERVDWGLGQWGLKVLSLVMSGMAGIGHYQCQQLLGERYARLDAVLEDDIDLDDIARIDDLVLAAEGVALDEALGWIRG